MSPNRIEPNEYRVKPGAKVSLRKWSTSATDGFDGDKEQGAALLPALNERLAELQGMLYAESKHKMLIILQGMDKQNRRIHFGHRINGRNLIRFHIGTQISDKK